MSAARAIRAALIAVGLLLMAWGAWVGWTTISSRDRVHVLLWFALGVVIHDGLLAPFSVVLGRFALPHLPVSTRWGARALLAWVAAVLIIGLPVVWQDRRRSNPTIEFGHPFVGVCVAIGLGIAVVAAIQIAMSARRLRSAKVS
jgi:hypothetical protein